VDTGKNSVVFGLAKVEAILTLEPGKPKGDHLFVHLLIPYATTLRKTVEASLQFPDIVLPALFLKPLWVCFMYTSSPGSSSPLRKLF